MQMHDFSSTRLRGNSVNTTADQTECQKSDEIIYFLTTVGQLIIEKNGLIVNSRAILAAKIKSE